MAEKKKKEEELEEVDKTLEDSKNEYLEMAQRIQAEFDNYRKRSADIVRVARIDGIVEAVTRFLPLIDAIVKAKDMISDKKVLEGLNLIERDLSLIHI